MKLTTQTVVVIISFLTAIIICFTIDKVPTVGWWTLIVSCILSIVFVFLDYKGFE